MSRLTEESELNLNLVKQLVREVYGHTLLGDLTITQAILEGALLSSPPSKLALDYCNLFGQKPSTTQGPWSTPYGTNPEDGGIVDFYTNEYVNGEHRVIKQPFLSNLNIEDSIQQHLKLLKGLSRYDNLQQATTFEQVAEYIRADGYSTDPHYTETLIEVYNEHVKEKS